MTPVAGSAAGLLRTLRPAAWILLLLLPACALRGRRAAPRPWLEGAVATVHPLATKAGLDALRAGGNAVDAAIAAALALGVVDSHNSGIGGGCFLLIHTQDRAILVIDGRETAPAAATRTSRAIFLLAAIASSGSRARSGNHAPAAWIAERGGAGRLSESSSASMPPGLNAPVRRSKTFTIRVCVRPTATDLSGSIQIARAQKTNESVVGKPPR